jgi:peptide-methionine (S)-S-oxide reductase
VSDGTELATLGGGCFWCLDAAFRRVEGVASVVSGYAGGHRADPTYEQVCSGSTGHAEVVQVEFDPQTLPYADVLDVFWAIHDPTSLNRQGADVGTQYRSIILYHDDGQKRIAESSRDAVQQLWSRPVVTEIVPLDVFYPAEEYHQDYYARNPEQGYCQVVINPKLTKLREHFASRLRAGA